jgi:hypothetical protein
MTNTTYELVFLKIVAERALKDLPVPAVTIPVSSKK